MRSRTGRAQRIPRWAPTGALLLICIGATGCGWTPRDEFYMSRDTVVHAKPGDGSQLAFHQTSHDRPAIGDRAAFGSRPPASALASVPEH